MEKQLDENLFSAKPQEQGSDNEIEYPFRQLPEELVTSVLLLLPLREATRTSILCKKYKCLWESSKEVRTSLLNLDNKLATTNSVDYTNLNEKEKREKFMTWAQKILLGGYTCKLLKFCKIAYPLRSNSRHYTTINEFVENLTSKRVQELSIDLTCPEENPKEYPSYVFRFSQLPLMNALKHLSLFDCYFLPPPLQTDAMKNTFSNLVSLTLGHTSLLNDQIFHILSTFWSLERLIITRCLCSNGIMVTASPPLQNYLKLKHFEIISCNYLRPGKEVTIGFHNAINLESENMVPKQLRTFSKLTTLDLDMYKGETPKGIFEVTCSILKACPLLHRFMIHLPSGCVMTENNNGLVNRNGGWTVGLWDKFQTHVEILRKIVKSIGPVSPTFAALIPPRMAVNLEKDNFSFQHEQLSHVEIDNFIGIQLQVDYLFQFLADVINLDKMIIRQSRKCGM